MQYKNLSKESKIMIIQLTLSDDLAVIISEILKLFSFPLVSTRIFFKNLEFIQPFCQSNLMSQIDRKYNNINCSCGSFVAVVEKIFSSNCATR